MILDYNELSTLLEFNEKENKLFMPNEIFNDLKLYIKDNSSHIAFAYSYIYLTTWLYRYTKYANVTVKLDQKKLKEILGYSPTYPEINYIIKKNGVLEQMNYLKTTTDYPVTWEFKVGEYSDEGIEELTFEMYSQFKDEYGLDYGLNLGRNFKVKYPVKAFTRNSATDDILDGTFYEVDNTHLVPFEVFLYCASNNKVGLTGFYIWCYLKMKCQMFESGYDVSLNNLSSEVGISNRTLIKYIDRLKRYKMIDFCYNQDYFVWGLQKEDRKSTTYITNDYELFSDEPVAYEKIKRMSHEDYVKLQNYKEEIKKYRYSL